MTKYIQSSEHTIIGSTGSPADTVEPGGRVLFNEEAESHKFLAAQIEAGDPAYSHLSIVDVDEDADQDQEQELEEKLEEAEQIASEQREEEARALAEQQESSGGDEDGVEGDTPPVPQLADADPPPQDKEAQRLAKKSGAGQRASSQEDTADEGDVAEPPKSRSRKAKE